MLSSFKKRTIDLLATSEVLNAEDNRFPDFSSTYKEILLVNKSAKFDIEKDSLLSLEMFI